MTNAYILSYRANARYSICLHRIGVSKDRRHPKMSIQCLNKNIIKTSHKWKLYFSNIYEDNMCDILLISESLNSEYKIRFWKIASQRLENSPLAHLKYTA